MRLRSLFVILSLFACETLQAVPLALSVHAESAILMNADTGVILYEKQANKQRYPASVTKIATAAFALHKAGDKLDQMITAEQDSVASISEEAIRKSRYTVPAYWLIPGGTHIGIKRGEELSLYSLLNGLMIASGNDAANVIAQHVGGTIPNFIKDLNVYLKSIGCKNTTFYNPHGLYHPDHKTTAYDMAIIMREALKNPIFREIIATVRFTRPTTNKQESSVLLQSNKMMRKGKYFYAKAIGGKTGYLSIANHTLVVAAKDEDRTLIAVLLKSKERNDTFLDATKMFETAFNQPKVERIMLKKGPQKFTLDLAGSSKAIKTYISDDLKVAYYPAEELKTKCLLTWKSLTPPVEKDQEVGELRLVTERGQVLQVVPLLAEEDVPATWVWTLRHPFG